MTEVEVHSSGSWIGDVIEEWKKLPIWGKVIAILIVLIVLFMAIRSYNNKSSIGAKTVSSNTSRGSNLQPTNSEIPFNPSTTTTDSSTTQQKPSLWQVLTRGVFKGQANNGGGVPVFDSPNVIFDKSGNFTNGITSIPLNTQVQVGSSVSGNYAGKQATYYPVTYNDKSGYILSTDLSKSSPPVSSGPPNGVQIGNVGKNDKFHIVQYGENMNHIAQVYGLDSWKDFGVDSFYHGQKVKIPS